jgi:hypothetical protein
MLGFTELLLIEAIRDTTYNYTIAYKANPIKAYPFHGIIDFLVYNSLSEYNYLPMVPVLLPSMIKYDLSGEIYEHLSVPGMYTCAKWFLEMSKINMTKLDYIRCLQTNGHMWVMNEVSNDGMKKTQAYMIRKERNGIEAYNEDDMKVVVGMLRYCFQIADSIVLGGKMCDNV